MATSLRRTPGGADSATIKFLFAVIKQLETKSVRASGSIPAKLNNDKVNWQHVANEINIPNGHAARMRFSRLKAQVEGTAPYGKANRNADGTPRKKRKTDIRTERKREAERLAAEATGRTVSRTESMSMKMEAMDVDADAHADDERDYSVPSYASEFEGYEKSFSFSADAVEPICPPVMYFNPFAAPEPSQKRDSPVKMELGLQVELPIR